MRRRFSMRYATVGVVVVSHTQDYLHECLESIDGQSRAPHRVVLVDNASPPGRPAGEIGLSHGVELIRFDCPVSLSAARNAGVATLHNCDLIATFDGDDIMEPDYLAEYGDAAGATRSQVVFGAASLFGSAEGVWFTEAERGPRPNLRRGNFVPANSMFAREVWERVGGFDPDQAVFEDWDFWLSCATAGARFTAIEQPLWRYRRHSASMLSSTGSKDKDAARRRIRLKHRSYILGPLKWRLWMRRAEKLKDLMFRPMSQQRYETERTMA